MGKQPVLRFRLQKFSYRFAEQILNSNLAIRQEVEDILLDTTIEIQALSRPKFNAVLRERFVAKGWEETNLRCSTNQATPVPRWIF